MSPSCGVKRILNEMDDLDSKALLSLLDSPIAAIAVSRELQSAGYKIGYQVIYRHRVRTCSCD